MIILFKINSHLISNFKSRVLFSTLFYFAFRFANHKTVNIKQANLIDHFSLKSTIIRQEGNCFFGYIIFDQIGFCFSGFLLCNIFEPPLTNIGFGFDAFIFSRNFYYTFITFTLKLPLLMLPSMFWTLTSIIEFTSPLPGKF